MKLFIEPNDVLMFRDGRPFAGGDDHFARGVFPPSPATFYGAFRSHILSHNWPEFNRFKSEPEQIPENVRTEIGTPNELGILYICQFTLAKRNASGIKQFFPMPKDVVKEKGREESKLNLLMPKDLSGSKTLTDMPYGLNNMWLPVETPREAVSGYLSSEDMSKYLFGEPPFKCINQDELFKNEERTGIQKSRMTRSVETGRLYSVEYFRLNEDVGFAIDFGNASLIPSNGILRLGGDNRSARYLVTSWDELSTDRIRKKIADTKRFKLVLTTPAIFNKGWLPGWINGDTRQGQIEGAIVKLVTACVGKPIGIGGYDFANNRSKVMKKAAPAGSVYYFEFVNGSVDALFEKMWLKSISDERAKEGFGITLIGGFDYV
ncbi:MAG: type III-B CRISPR module-associated protein Cmr3 [Nitrospirae bacterium]|nr:type III-B CRISPR module-associated protein Cmr3 [Nitrospirota bacterium]